METSSLAENLFFVTVKIDTVSKDGERGSGTGFLFSHSVDDQHYIFIVTNKHVVAGAKSGGFSFIAEKDGKPDFGNSHRVQWDDKFTANWFGHPDPSIDLAVTPFVPALRMFQQLNKKIFYRTINSINLPKEEDLKTIDAIEEIVFVGYPNGIWDQKNFIPVVRKGITATPFTLDFEGEKKFLIDASVFGGSSGSPVFIYNNGTFVTKGGHPKVGTRFIFIGVVASVFFKTDFNEIISLPIPMNKSQIAVDKEMIDLGIVIKAELILDVVQRFVRQVGTQPTNSADPKGRAAD